MSKWEDIFKNSLEDYSSGLPEGSLESFQKKMKEKGKAAPSRAYYWLAVPAAACMAMFLILHGPASDVDVRYERAAEIIHMTLSGQDEQEIRVLPVPKAQQLAHMLPSPLARAGSSFGEECSSNSGIESFSDNVHVAADDPVSYHQSGNDCLSDNAPVTDIVFVLDGGDSASGIPSDSEEAKAALSFPETPASPVMGMNTGALAGNKKETNLKAVISASGGLLAGSVLGFLPSPAMKADKLMDGGLYMDVAPVYSKSAAPANGDLVTLGNAVISETHHFMPFKAAVGVRFPMSERLYFVTGAEYSLYRSAGERYLTGSENQSADYLGVPLRIDWSVLKRKRLDLYLGAGPYVDFCVAARQNGSAVSKDPASVSLMAAGGVLLKFNEYLGLFLEPQLSWTPRSSNGRLDTYRTEHPVMFTVSSGIRFTLFE